ncbi:MAG TPA: outer membrane beta-barrel protein [Burkholderiaceae bacterium]
MTRLTFPTALRRPAPALALAAAFACAAPALAAPSPAEGTTPEAAAPARIRPVAGVLVTGSAGKTPGFFTNPDGTTVTGSLGGRYEAFAGAEFPVDPNGLALRVTAGIHVTSGMTASNGASEHFSRFPLEATFWYPLNDKLRIGAGGRYSLRPRFSGPGGRTSDKLSSMPALVMGVGYQLIPHVLLEGRYVYERFEQYGGDDVEASHWGLGVTAIY